MAETRANAARRFAVPVRRLAEAAYRFDEAGRAATAAALEAIGDLPLPGGAGLRHYHQLLLFLRAHPADDAMLRRVESEFRRVAAHVKALPPREREALANEGLPHADTVTRFSHDCLRLLLARRDLAVNFDHAGEPTLALNDVLRLTLPAPEWCHTAKGLDDDELLAELGVPVRGRLPFLVGQLAALDCQPFVKDHFFDALDLFVRVSSRRAAFSKAWNRLPMPAVFWQQDRIRRFDTLALMNRRLPRARIDGVRSPAREVDEAVRVIRDTLTLTARETDPGTYLDARSLRVFDLERGLSVALYGMVPERQLPFESYVGLMLFKNGMPAAYGGSWVFGGHADFGMNIFEPYRGGESGFMMCQLLRAYRQAFGVRTFEVDAHQFGLDNPDGIASGAFWFYYRHGFRPVEPALARRAERESRRLAASPGARSSEQTLLAFTGSSVALHFGGKRPLALPAVSSRITAMIARRFGGDRERAERAALDRLARQGAPLRAAAVPGGARVACEMALLAMALGIEDAPRLALLRRLVVAKPRDVYRYQRGLLQLLEGA